MLLGQVLPLDLGSSSAPPYSTGYPTTDRRTMLCIVLGGGSAKTCRVYVGEPDSSHWRPLFERPTHWLKGGEWVAYQATTTTTTTGYPAAVELLGPRPRPKPQWHDGCVRARLSITPIKCYHWTLVLPRHRPTRQDTLLQTDALCYA